MKVSANTGWRFGFANTILAMIMGGTLTTFVRVFVMWWLKRRRGEQNWRRHVDFHDIQACLLSTEHLKELGRVEKRTLFVKSLDRVFKNEYIREKVIEAAEAASASGDPLLLPNMSSEDKWHVLNSCMNRVSACFAPYHIFFNEARRTRSHYQSAWYCFTITCHRTSAGGRWMITPFKKVSDDVGILRIRIVLMNEQELRDIVSGAIEVPESGFFNGRHESRWKVCIRFSELFARQLQGVAGSGSMQAGWGPNLCGTMKKKQQRVPSIPASLAEHRPPSPGVQPELEPEDNSILRIHIPFPSREAQLREEDGVCKDVVLFE